MTLARTIGGLPALERELLDADRAEIETADGLSRRVTLEQLRDAVLADATPDGLELLASDRDTQKALLGSPGGGLPPLSPGGVPYGGPSGGVAQIPSTADGRELLSATREQQQALLGVGDGGFQNALVHIIDLGFSVWSASLDRFEVSRRG